MTFIPTDEQWADIQRVVPGAGYLYQNVDLAASFGVSEATIRRVRQSPRRAVSAPQAPAAGPLGAAGAVIDPDGTRTVTSPPMSSGLATVQDAEAYLRERWNLPADVWGVKPITVNEWEANAGGGVVMTLGQVKGTFYPLAGLEAILPAPARWSGRTFPRGRDILRGHYRIMVVGDDQAPYNDAPLHVATCMALRELQPERIAHIGDLCDYTNISRHPDHAVVKASVDECTQAGVDILVGMREAAPNAHFQILAGNHDIRPLSELLQRAERMADIHCAALPGDEHARPRLLDLRALWRLDDLGIEYVEDDRGWRHGQLDLIPGPRGLAAVHGDLTGKNVALNTLASVGRSVICGHTHRPEIVHQWNPTIGFEMRGMVIGAQCAVRGAKRFPTFVARDKWLQGGALVTVFADGEWSAERMRWNGSSLFVAGQRFTP